MDYPRIDGIKLDVCDGGLMNIKSGGQGRESAAVIDTEQDAATMLAELGRISHGDAHSAWVAGIDFDITHNVRGVNGSEDKGASGEFAVEPAGCGQEKRPFAAANRRVGNPEHCFWRGRV